MKTCPDCNAPEHNGTIRHSRDCVYSDDVPTSTEPEYMTWSIDKLRREYSKLLLSHSSLRIRASAMEHREKVMAQFFASLEEIKEEQS